MIPLGKRRFFGINRRPGRTWTSITRVTDDVPGERYAFNVSVPVVPVSRWEYVIAPTATGCRVTESAWDRRPRWAVPLTVLVTGVSDRQATNTANIAATLARLKARCEA